MKNLDVLNQEKMAIMQEMQTALQENNTEAFSGAFAKFSDNIAQKVTAQFEAQQQSADANVLASRGTRQLTSEESRYFQKLGEAMKSANPKQALADLDVVMPKTTIDAVFEDLTSSHPLLNAISFRNTSGLIEMIVNTHEDQLGTWSPLTAEITKELTSGFKKINLSLTKYSAFIPVAKAMLDLGPAWLETYVRTILQETIYLGLEEAILKGTGKDMPIGMNRKVGEGVTVTDGVYPEKDTVAVTALDPVTYGGLLSVMAKTPNGHQRTIQNGNPGGFPRGLLQQDYARNYHPGGRRYLCKQRASVPHHCYPVHPCPGWENDYWPGRQVLYGDWYRKVRQNRVF